MLLCFDVKPYAFTSLVTLRVFLSIHINESGLDVFMKLYPSELAFRSFLNHSNPSLVEGVMAERVQCGP